MVVFFGWKLCEISGIYWNNLLNRIDFRLEIGHHYGFVGGKKNYQSQVSEFI